MLAALTAMVRRADDDAGRRPHAQLPGGRPSCWSVLLPAPLPPPPAALVAAHTAWLTTVTAFSAATGPWAPAIQPSTTRRAPAALAALPAHA